MTLYRIGTKKYNILSCKENIFLNKGYSFTRGINLFLQYKPFSYSYSEKSMEKTQNPIYRHGYGNNRINIKQLYRPFHSYKLPNKPSGFLKNNLIFIRKFRQWPSSNISSFEKIKLYLNSLKYRYFNRENLILIFSGVFAIILIPTFFFLSVLISIPLALLFAFRRRKLLNIKVLNRWNDMNSRGKYLGLRLNRGGAFGDFNQINRFVNKRINYALEIDEKGIYSFLIPNDSNQFNNLNKSQYQNLNISLGPVESISSEMRIKQDTTTNISVKETMSVFTTGIIYNNNRIGIAKIIIIERLNSDYAKLRIEVYRPLGSTCIILDDDLDGLYSTFVDDDIPDRVIDVKAHNIR